MKDFSLSDVRLFTKAAQLGGLTPAAEVLNVPKASASRQLQRLEATVGHLLLHRGATRFALTEEGREFLAAAQHALTILDDVMLNLSSEGGAVSGRLRIAVPHYCGRELLMNHLPAFMTAYPRLEVTVETSRDRADLLHDGADVAIRCGREGSDELVVRHLAQEPLMLCAAPAYLARHAPVQGLPDLAAHRFLTTDTEGRKREISLATVEKTHQMRVESVFRSDDPEMVLRLALSARGIALLPVSLARPQIDGATLVPVLPSLALKPHDIELSYLPARRNTPKIKTFVDYFLDVFRSA
ncbi:MULTISPECIES: LysR family transcriptional regulator [unclassified Variovorax]|jgi:DNA-binding transcriptional LysR family regulator|uniref:LysR family transcriptional regulator n=1 Tax=unclassified Variovorax TaxID=663243 RepID=UPI000F7EF339|nr:MULTISPECIES: LysR family transcriptional regulator [unclassified Variovorax]RSZ45955.1 LysR family transcriptional regulator [Variovorax sp. 553]RSZ46591.1 LysR family transcriptional regulator [Variovorax sp. 679]